MNSLVNFIYESGICLAILVSLYWLFLRKETYFRFNRYYLLGTIVVAYIFPLLSFKVFLFGSEASIPQIAEAISIPEVAIDKETNPLSGPGFNLELPAIVIYLTGVSLLLIRMILGIIKVSMLKRKGRTTCLEGYSIVHMRQELAPFSFFRTIYLNDALVESADKQSVISHELTHIRQKHSYDTLFVEFFLALFWFNPFMWLLRGALRSTHEFLADDGVIDKSTSLYDYQSLLLKHLNGLLPIAGTNNFNSTIKKRITMMYRNKSSVWAKLKTLLVVPVLICLTLLFACNENPVELIEETGGEEMADEMLTITAQAAAEYDSLNEAVVDEEIFYIVEEMPTFNGGEPATEFRKYIARNLSYPEVAVKNKISGRVIVQFAVDKEGKVVDALVVRSIDPALDQEAVRVVLSSPPWTPGIQSGKKVKVLFTFPINFVIN